MRNCTNHVGTLEIVKRLKKSINGNSRFLIRVGGFTCRTAPDSCLADYVKNYEGKEVVATIGTHYGHATLNSLRLKN